MYVSLWGTTSLHIKGVVFTKKICGKEAIIDKHTTFTTFCERYHIQAGQKMDEVYSEVLWQGPSLKEVFYVDKQNFHGVLIASYL